METTKVRENEVYSRKYTKVKAIQPLQIGSSIKKDGEIKDRLKKVAKFLGIAQDMIAPTVFPVGDDSGKRSTQAWSAIVNSSVVYFTYDSWILIDGTEVYSISDKLFKLRVKK